MYNANVSGNAFLEIFVFTLYDKVLYKLECSEDSSPEHLKAHILTRKYNIFSIVHYKL